MKNLFIATIDYKVAHKNSIDYKFLNADNLMDAMDEAETYLDTETVYLIKVAQADNAPCNVRGMKGFKSVTCTDLLTNRGHGWHRTDTAHREIAWKTTLWFDENNNASAVDMKQVG